METLCENNKHYRNQLLVWAITYCAVTYASVYALKNAGIENFGRWRSNPAGFVLKHRENVAPSSMFIH